MVFFCLRSRNTVGLSVSLFPRSIDKHRKEIILLCQSFGMLPISECLKVLPLVRVKTYSYNLYMSFAGAYILKRGGLSSFIALYTVPSPHSC